MVLILVTCFRFQLIAYFGERMISEETLRRNAVMQMSGNQVSEVYLLQNFAACNLL